MHVGVDVDVGARIGAALRGADVECEIIQTVGVVFPLLQCLLLGGKAVIGIGGVVLQDASSVLHAVCAAAFASQFDVEGRFCRRFEGKRCVGIRVLMLLSAGACTSVSAFVVIVEMFARGHAAV